ncbi:MAG: insulinase family protein [Nannocystaceae bacterium]
MTVLLDRSPEAPRSQLDRGAGGQPRRPREFHRPRPLPRAHALQGDRAPRHHRLRPRAPPRRPDRAALYGELRGAKDEPPAPRSWPRSTPRPRPPPRPRSPTIRPTPGRARDHRINAFTSDEETVYISTVPKNRLEAWAKLEADRFQHPIFRLFYPELEAVYEEKNISLDDPEERVWEQLRAGLFPRHPYGTQTTIGEVEHLKNPAYGDMVDFFARHYAPNNVAVILAGDIDPKTALPVLEEAFAGWAPRALTPAPAAAPPSIAGKGRVFKEIVAEGEQSVQIAWRTASARSAEEPVLTVMDWLVAGDGAGILDVELVLAGQVPDATTFNELLRDGGYWGLEATARDGQVLDDVEALLLGAVKKLKAGEFTQEDLDAIVLHHEIADKRSLESSYGRVSKMLHAYVHHLPWEDVVRHTQRLRAVTREQVIEAANKYLGDDRVVVFRRRGEHRPPAIGKPSITPVTIDVSRHSAFADEIRAMPADEIAPQQLREGEDYRHDTFPAGPLIWTPNRHSDLFELTYHYDIGSRKRPLACHALDLLELSGAGDLDAAALQRRLFQLGTSIDARCSADALSITVSGIDRNLKESVRLLELWLRSPVFTDETVRALLANTLSQRKDALDDPDFVGHALALFASRGKESPLLAEPSNAVLAQVPSTRLAREINDIPDLAHTTLYFGPRDVASLREVAVLGKNHRQLAPPTPLRYRKVDKPTIYFAHKDVAQAVVGIFFGQPPLPTTEWPRAELYSQVLGGDMSGLVFQEIREARGLAYGAHASYHYGERKEDMSSLIADLGTQADKARDALGLLLDLLRQTPIAEGRFTAAKTALLEDYRAQYIAPRGRARTVLRWDHQGLREDPRPWLLGQVGALTLDAIQGFAGRFAGTPPVISVMGDRARLDLKALGDLAAVEVVSVDRLVSYGPFPIDVGQAGRAR